MTEEFNLPPVTEEESKEILEDMMFSKGITLRHQQNHVGDTTIIMEKRYRTFTDVAKVEVDRDAPLSDTLDWIQNVLLKFNKKEI